MMERPDIERYEAMVAAADSDHDWSADGMGPGALLASEAPSAVGELCAYIRALDLEAERLEEEIGLRPCRNDALLGYAVRGLAPQAGHFNLIVEVAQHQHEGRPQNIYRICWRLVDEGHKSQYMTSWYTDLTLAIQAYREDVIDIEQRGPGQRGR